MLDCYGQTTSWHKEKPLVIGGNQGVLGEFAVTPLSGFGKGHGNVAAKRTGQEKRAVVPAGHIVPMACHRLTPDGIERHCNKQRTRAGSAPVCGELMLRHAHPRSQACISSLAAQLLKWKGR